MLEKIKALLGSIRFYIVTLAAVSAVLTAVADGVFSSAVLFETLRNWLAAVVAIGSLDSVATKLKAQ